MSRASIVSAAAALALAAQGALAAFSITDGNATFSTSLANTNPFSNSSLNTYDFRPEGGTSTDQVFYYNWGYRVPLGSNTGMSHLVAPSISNPDAQTIVLDMPNNGPGAVGQNRFDSRVTIRITDGALPGEARLDSTLQVTSLTSNTGPVTYQFFHVVDVDFNGTAGNDVYNITNPSGVDGTVTDSALTAPAVLGEYSGLGANLFQLGSSSTMRAIINGSSAASLNGTATFSGDGAYGFQWTVTLAPGESATFSSSFRTVVPEPAAIGLFAAAAPILLRRRRG
jgi:hypothetical protein